MNTDNKQLPIKREDYESMLQHAVAVIEHARLEIAKHINGHCFRILGDWQDAS